MANGTESIERIAADILIAAMQNSSDVSARNALCKPENIAEHYKTIHKAVEDAKRNRLT